MSRSPNKSEQLPNIDPPSDREYARTAQFRAALRRFARVSRDLLANHGLTERQYVLLVLIRGAPDGAARATISELADGLQLAPNTVTELVRRAEAAGLVARVPNEADGRSIYARLTPEGDRRLARAVRALDFERRRLAEVVAAAVLEDESR